MESRCGLVVVLLAAALLQPSSSGDMGGAAAGNSRQLEADGRDGRDGTRTAADGRSSVLADIAREMVMRSATSSQVLSLNLTNLLVLLILKALLFGAGIFSFGFLKDGGHPGGHGRSAADGSVSAALDEPEVLLMLSFLMGDATRQYDCLYRVACEQPRRAREYALAAKMLLKGTNMLGSVGSHDPRYEAIVSGLQEAADLGSSGAELCSRRYSCDSSGGGGAALPAD